MRLAAVVLVALAAVYNTHAEYNFDKAVYSFVETRDGDNSAGASDVLIRRTAAAAAAATATQTITLWNTCPSGVQATARRQLDYTFTTTVTFPVGSLQQGVTLTIKQDTDQENEEIFCLTIRTEPGTTQPSAVFSIPENDYCYTMRSLAASNYDLGTATYVGPWNTDEMLDIEITPEDGGAGDDVCIFLTNIADTLHADLRYYEIILDDTALETTHDGGAGNFMDGHSGIINNDIGNTGDVVSSYPTDILTNGNTESLWVSYDFGSGTLSYGRTSNRNSALDTHDFGAGDTYDIKHVFVSSCGAASDDKNEFKICQPIAPIMQLPIQTASSNGFQLSAGPLRATDGDDYSNFEEYVFTCFLSADVPNPYIRVDLGKEYDVSCVIIHPVRPDTIGGISFAESDLDGARIKVGSCEADNLATNHDCSTDIGDEATDPSKPWSVECSSGSIGRYVYIYKASNSATFFALCEIYVYGREVTYDSADRTTVEFTATSYAVSENTPAINTITATRTGDRATCTTVEYFTNDKTAYGSDTGNVYRDYNELAMYSDDPKTLEWLDDSTSAITRTLNDVVLYNDDECEETETFTIELRKGSIKGGFLGQLRETTVNITDDDSMVFTLRDPISSISEGSGPLTLYVDRAGPGFMQEATAELVFTDGSATSRDYSNSDQLLEFSSSQIADSAMTDVDLVDDECYETDETFTVRLGTLSPYLCSSAGDSTPQEVTIQDNDSEWSWEDVGGDTNTISIREGEEDSIDIIRKGDSQSKTVEFQIDRVYGTLEDGEFSISPSDNSVEFSASDSSESIAIAIADDYEVENTETFSLTLHDPLAGDCPGRNLGAPYRINIQILDNDAEYEWSEVFKTVAEDSASVQVCLRRRGYLMTSQTVRIISSGNTGAFTPLTQIAFTSGEDEACVNVAIRTDDVPEGTETFTLTIDPNQNLAIGSQSVLTVTITDDDSVVSWARQNYQVPESANTVRLSITKTGSRQVSVSVSTSSSSATSGLDFAPLTTTITIPANQNSYDLDITIVDDQLDDNSESFIVTLTSASSGSIISSPTTTVLIIDDDPAPTEPPPSSGLSGGAIAGIVVAAIVGLLVIIGAVAFLLWMVGGAGADAAAGTAGVAGIGGAYGAQQGLQVANYPNTNAYGLQNFSYGNGYGNGFGPNTFGGNKPYGFP